MNAIGGNAHGDRSQPEVFAYGKDAIGTAYCAPSEEPDNQVGDLTDVGTHGDEDRGDIQLAGSEDAGVALWIEVEGEDGIRAMLLKKWSEAIGAISPIEGAAEDADRREVHVVYGYPLDLRPLWSGLVCAEIARAAVVDRNVGDLVELPNYVKHGQPRDGAGVDGESFDDDGEPKSSGEVDGWR